MKIKAVKRQTLEARKRSKLRKFKKIRPLLERNGYNLSKIVFLKNLAFDLKRFAVFKCQDQKGRGVVIKIAPFNNERGMKLLLDEYKLSEKLFNLWRKLNLRKVRIPQPLGWHDIKYNNKESIYTVNEFIKEDKRKRERMPDREYFNLVKGVLEEMQSINFDKLKTIKELKIWDAKKYIDTASENLETLKKFNIFSQKEREQIIDLYHKTSLDKYINVFCHGDFSDINFIIDEEKKLVLIDLEMVHIGNKFEDWARYITRAELFKPKLKKELIKIIKSLGKKSSSILETYLLTPARYKVIEWIPNYLQNIYKDSPEALECFRIMRIDRLIWYISRKIQKIHKSPIYPIYKRVLEHYQRLTREILGKS